MTTARKPAGDLTGRQAEKLAQARDAEAKERAKSMATATIVAESEKSDVVVDLVENPKPEVEEQPVVVEEAPREIRVNANLTDVVIGQGNYFTFEVGVPYRVPAFVANHLEEKGLVWH
ncbi:hypothetical protein [Streptomyces sp. RTd22]|uniref:hypothetical protein n=1 Tax=Streptomyces sp. RTd22 TaxID=1841249 RepID=UPI0007C50A86|nr:hypothetical protein [Streptomyces sp. RTd22]